MTRINVGILPELLTDEHLLAKHREIKRVCNRFKQRMMKKKFDDIPEHFKLGTGHEMYFVTRPGTTLLRYNFLHVECKERGFNVQDYSKNWEIYEQHAGNFPLKLHQTTQADALLIAERIRDRIIESTKEYFHFKGERISKYDAIAKLRPYFGEISEEKLNETMSLL